MAIRANMSVNDMIVRHHETMLKWARKLTRGDDSLARDLVQTACIYALQNKTPYAEITNPKAWMNGCVRNAFRDACAKNARLIPMGDANEVAGHIGADGAQEYQVAIREVGAVLKGMTATRRQAFILVEIIGHTQVEAAVIMGKSEQTISWNVRTAREDILANAPRIDMRRAA